MGNPALGHRRPDPIGDPDRGAPGKRVGRERFDADGRSDPRVVPVGRGGEETVGLRGSPRSAVVEMDRAGLVERWLHDAPRLLDDVLTGEAPRVAGDGVVEQALVSIVAFAEGGGEVDREIDRLAVELRRPASWPAR